MSCNGVSENCEFIDASPRLCCCCLYIFMTGASICTHAAAAGSERRGQQRRGEESRGKQRKAEERKAEERRGGNHRGSNVEVELC